MSLAGQASDNTLGRASINGGALQYGTGYEARMD